MIFMYLTFLTPSELQKILGDPIYTHFEKIQFSYLILKHSIRYINLEQINISLLMSLIHGSTTFCNRTTFFTQKMLSH